MNHRHDKTPDQALMRLARNGRGQPDTLHRVTVLSCDCRGFQMTQRCMQHSLLLFHIGELPPATGKEDAIEHTAA